MPVRTAYAGTAIAGDVYTAANHARMPGGWIGYNQVVADQLGITTEVTLTGLSVTVTVNANRRIRITGSATIVTATANASAIGSIRRGGVELGRWATTPIVATDEFFRAEASVVVTPAAGANTYDMNLARLSSSGSVGISASATAPSFILVEDLGPAT